VVVVAPGRVHIDREPPRLREAPQHVLREPGVALEPQLGRGPSAEVDRRPGEGIVHRHDRVPVTRDAATVA
jgi:hypothetical protein